MDAAPEQPPLAPDLRAELEAVLRRIVEANGSDLPRQGVREFVLRLDEAGRLLWLTGTRWRMAATEL